MAIHSRWPNKDFPGRAITLITAGSRRDQVFEPRVLSNTNSGTNQTKSVWQIAECTQPLQLDVWATSHDERDDLLARLDIALHGGYSAIRPGRSNPVEGFFAVELSDGWEDLGNTTAQFHFDSADYEDSADTIQRCQFRATYSGEAFMKLAIAAITPRQIQINVRNMLDGDAEVTTIDAQS